MGAGNSRCRDCGEFEFCCTCGTEKAKPDALTVSSLVEVHTSSEMRFEDKSHRAGPRVLRLTNTAGGLLQFKIVHGGTSLGDLGRRDVESLRDLLNAALAAPK